MTALDLTTWREQRGWSQSALARALGVRHSTIFRWETGRSAIPPFLALALSALNHGPTTPPFHGDDEAPR
jgi:transcriptional regulator with XRE-family HTH domain